MEQILGLIITTEQMIGLRIYKNTQILGLMITLEKKLGLRIIFITEQFLYTLQH